MITPIPDDQIATIKHVQKSVLFIGERPRVYKTTQECAEVCELVDLFILNGLGKKFERTDVGL